MKKLSKFATLALAVAALSGCGPKPLDCDDETVANIIGNEIKGQIRQALINNAVPIVGGPKVSEAEIQTVLSEFKPRLVSTRTIRHEETGNKSFCAGKIAFDVSQDALASATRGMDRNNLDSTMNLLLLEAWAHATNGDFDVFGKKAAIKTGERQYGEGIEYMAQPTDKGDEIYVEFSKAAKVTSFLTQLSSAAINGSRPARVPQVVSAPVDDAASCVDGKVAEFRASEGEEALVRSDMLAEWEDDCARGQ